MEITPSSGQDSLAKKPNSYTLNESFAHMFDGIRVLFPSYKHDHPPVINVNEVAEKEMTFGQKVADGVAAGMGSWPYIIIQSVIVAIWIVLNTVGWYVWKWDLPPFILLNLIFSTQASYAAPIIMMSQNRQSEKDRLTAQNDYLTDCKGEEEIRYLMEHLDHQDTVIAQILQSMEAHHKEVLLHLGKLDPATARRLGADLQQLGEEVIEAREDIGGTA
jgi:uncharacterized membrane protein